MTVRQILAVCLVGCAGISAADLASPKIADAAQQGDWATVRTLAAARSGVNVQQADGMTALHWAVRANEEDVVAVLLKAGADANTANRYGITPLWLAATNGSVAVTQALLHAKADPKAALPHGETALMAAARTGNPDEVRVLLQAGSDPNAAESSEGETALMWAAAENHADAVRALIQGGADPNRHSKNLNLAPMDWMQVGMVSTILPRGGFTALMYAARQDSPDAARALAQSGADLDAQDPDGSTALLFAIINQHYDLAALLVERGANPNAADNTGMTAVYAAVDMNTFRSDIGRPPRVLPDKRTALDVLKLALQHKGDPNARLKKPIIGRHHGFGDGSLGDGATPLMRAAKSADLDAMRVLLDAGADAKLGMTKGSNAVMILAGTRAAPGSSEKAAQALRLLLQHGGDVNALDARGDRPIHAAARAGANEMVRLLVQLGADPNAANGAGKTALDLASAPGRGHHEDTAALLRELGARKPAN
jgi:ankyrin repeat protein